MKKYLWLLCLVSLALSGCGGSSGNSNSSAQQIDYFSHPVALAATMPDSTGLIDASNVIISGVSRTNETITLNFSVTVSNSGTTPQDIVINLSGRDRYNLEVMAPTISASVAV